MSSTTTGEIAAVETAAPVKNLRQTRKEAAAAKASTAGNGQTANSTKTPAKKAAEKPVEKAEGKTYIATATGRGGKTNVRKVPVPAHFAVDVADPDGRTPAAKAGLVYRFFSTREKAEEFAARKNGEGYDAIVIPATSKEA